MKIVKYYLYLLSVIIFLSGCGKKEETENIKKDSTVVNNDTSIIKQAAGNDIEDPGYYKSKLSLDEYIKQHPNLNRQIEFEDLIANLAVDKSSIENNEYVQQWAILSDNSTSPVNWLSKSTNNKKTGEVILTFDGKPAEILDRYILPIIWNVTMAGNSDGVNKVKVDCGDILARRIGELNIPKLLSKKNIKASLVDTSGDAETGEKDFKVSVPEKQMMWMIYSWSCGSGGCSADFKIYYNENKYKTEKAKPKVP